MRMCKIIKVESCKGCPYFANYMITMYGAASSKYAKPYCSKSKKFIKPNKSNAIPRWCELEMEK